MANDNRPFEIAIVGGGISGLVLAIALHRRGVQCHIYEQAAHFGEIGAGVAFGPNAGRAMKICAPEVFAAFEKVATRNQSPEKRDVWFDWLDGYHDDEVGKETYCFKQVNETGANSVHRAHFLDELVKAAPEGLASFGKHLEDVEEQGERLLLRFHDGSTAPADAVVGCDGIKSRVRQILLGGRNHPSAQPVYTHKYAYRGLIPMETAAAALGDENARNAKMHMGKDGHILTFPVNHGRTMNVVAFKTNPDPWPDSSRLVKPSQKEDAMKDFASFGATMRKVIELLDPSLDCWAIFDTGEHPLPFFCKGRICVLGDAAHATSPHMGAGAGICIEDAAVMSAILASDQVKSRGAEGLPDAFKVFESIQKERGQWLVQSSRRVGDLYEWRAEGVGEDVSKIEEELRSRLNTIWKGDVAGAVQKALSAVKNTSKI